MTKIDALINEAEAEGLWFRHISENSVLPVIISRKGRGAAAVTVWQDGSITRADVDLTIALKMNVAQARKVLGL